MRVSGWTGLARPHSLSQRRKGAKGCVVFSHRSSTARTGVPLLADAFPCKIFTDLSWTNSNMVAKKEEYETYSATDSDLAYGAMPRRT